MKNGFSFAQVVVILMLSNGLMNHFIVIPMMLDVAKRDAWISVLLSGALYLLWIGILYFVYQKTQKDHLLRWIKDRFGSVVYVPIALLLSLYCFLNATVTMEDTVTWISLSFAPETPIFVHSIIFASLCLVNALLDIRSIAMMSSILLPVVVVLGFFVMTTNFQHKDYSFLLPIMENGFSPVSQGMLYAGGGFAELILFLLLQHHLKTKISYLQIILLGVTMIGLTLGLPLAPLWSSDLWKLRNCAIPHTKSGDWSISDCISSIRISSVFSSGSAVRLFVYRSFTT
ncbi:endospore germination permease [Brevibacillus centrosporus]|uniref:endospore germination permease n=1 Tax=Brevibacillus centrosporus TaxID=54910 RepID=UPI00147688B2|nr:endospore germination permease [Brevibacillus centrosporus]MEC2131757.1 endospore germination permease [Brevibacillus centrosporus]